MFHQMDFIVFLSCLVLLNVQSSHGSEIIGGTEVVPHSMPFMALLEGTKGEYCGGTLIHPLWVLTAAHCTNMNRVLLGVHSIKAAEIHSKQVLKIVKSFPHPKPSIDIMLLKLEKPAKETETVKVLKVGSTVQYPKARTRCTVAGWGRTVYNVQKRSDVLMSVDVTVIYTGICDDIKNSEKICAVPGGKVEAGPCRGDSGGPLLCGGKQVGVISHGPPRCGRTDDTSIFFYLSQQTLNWIQNTMKNSEA